jgi:hypothetical protein
MQLHFQKPPQLGKPFQVVVQRFVSSSCSGLAGGKASNVHVLTSCRHADSSVVHSCVHSHSTWRKLVSTDVTFGDMNAHHKHRWILSVRFPF